LTSAFLESESFAVKPLGTVAAALVLGIAAEVGIAAVIEIEFVVAFAAGSLRPPVG
jgi:hypothetical protein